MHLALDKTSSDNGETYVYIYVYDCIYVFVHIMQLISNLTLLRLRCNQLWIILLGKKKKAKKPKIIFKFLEVWDGFLLCWRNICNNTCKVLACDLETGKTGTENFYIVPKHDYRHVKTFIWERNAFLKCTWNDKFVL